MRNSILSIGYGRHLFDEKNQELKRLQGCAKELEQFSLIVFSTQTDGLRKKQIDSKLTLYPTNSFHKLLIPFDAFLIGLKILKHKKQQYVITSQDPFETGIVGLLLKFLSGRPLVVQEHGDVFSGPYWRGESFGNYLRFVVGKFVLHFADSVRVVSLRSKETLLNFGIKRVFVLPVAIDTSAFTNQLIRTEEKYFPSDTFVFLTVARLVKQKNLPLLIRAFKQVYDNNSNARLLLVGDGPERRNLEREISKQFGVLREDSPIKLLPWSDNVPGLMRSADAYVLSSNYEGWGRVLIEAMVCELPVVTTDVGCAREVIIDNVHGLVVPVGDEAAFVQAMQLLSSNSDLYERIKATLRGLQTTDIPGTKIDEYGVVWVHALFDSLNR